MIVYIYIYSQISEASGRTKLEECRGISLKAFHLFKNISEFSSLLPFIFSLLALSYLGSAALKEKKTCSFSSGLS